MIEEKPKLEYDWKIQTVCLRTVAEALIAELNRLIQNSSEHASVKGMRYLVLEPNGQTLNAYKNLGPPLKSCITEQEEKQIWLRRIIQALVEKGHLYKLDKINNYGYIIQA